ncbi:30S ribosomal protein S12 [compost metagenome]|jgi:small subunit ribosomal protein S12
MITINQLLFVHKRKSKKTKTHVPRLQSCPQKRGVVVKVFEQTPRKPNSAKRKCVRVKLSSGKKVSCHVPGIGHNLQQHSVVLVRGGRCQDLIGVRYKPIRGKFDLLAVKGRITRRSKFGLGSLKKK